MKHEVFLQNVYTSSVLYFTGPFATMDNLTVNALCNFTIDHHRPMVNCIERLDIKTFGHMLVVTDREATTTLQGTTLTVRSGASVGTKFLKFFSIIYSCCIY